MTDRLPSLYRISRLKALSLALSLGLGMVLTGCAPIASHQGYLAIDADPAKDVAIGETVTSVRDKLGTPTLTASFDPNIWYYVDQTSERMTYKAAKTTSRKVVIITFDKGTQKVSSVKTLGIAEGRDITPNPNATPTRGRAMTALEQILGTVGRQALPNDQENNPGNQRRRE